MNIYGSLPSILALPWCLSHETFAESTKKNEGEAYPISCIGTAIFAPWEIIELTC